MNINMNAMLNQMTAVPVTGDEYRPWIAAVILILSVIVLVTLILVSKRSDDREDTYQDEDEDREK